MMQNSSEQLSRRVEAAISSAGGSEADIYAAILKRINELNLSGSVLDFGAGTGALTKQLCSLGRFTEVTAADLVKYEESNGTESNIKWIHSDLNESLPLPSESYDAIVACEVIEHLENPRFLAREWYRLLKPNGAILLSTPNNESWRSLVSLVVRGHFIAFTDPCYPAHITALVRSDLRRILSEAGFAEVNFSYTDCGGIPKIPKIRWQQISMGLLKGLRFSDNVVCSAQKLK